MLVLSFQNPKLTWKTYTMSCQQQALTTKVTFIFSLRLKKDPDCVFPLFLTNCLMFSNKLSTYSHMIVQIENLLVAQVLLLDTCKSSFVVFFAT
jgi:hypothetical protein